MIARLVALLGVLVLLPCGVRVVDAVETFDYAIDRFEIDGNVHGPLDGVPDLVDDFEDGVMGPVFRSFVGTSSESGGALHLQSPGFSAGILGVTPVRFETSAAIDVGAVLQVGGGDAVLRATIPSQAVGPNDAINLFLSWYDADGLYYGGMSLANLNRPLGDLFSPPIPPGLSIFSHLEELGYPDNRILSLEPRAIDPLTVTGPVVLELGYDDTAHTLTPRYSVDGGVSFAPPLAALAVDTTAPTFSVYLAGVAYAGDCPAGVTIQNARLRGLGAPGRSRAKLRLLIPRTLGYETMRLVLRDQGAGGAVLLDAQLPDTLISTPHCDPRDGWFGGGGALHYRYKSYGNALPPDCIAGSARGLRRYETRWTGTAHVSVTVADASFPAVVGPLRAEFYYGAGPANACDGFVGDAPCTVGPGTATCRVQ